MPPRVERLTLLCAYPLCGNAFAIIPSVLHKAGKGRFCSAWCAKKDRGEQRTIPLPERFWSKVAIGVPNECWEWQGSRQSSGYGRLWVNERMEKVGAHVVRWFIEHGTWPEPGMNICHTCDNPPCINIAHLWMGTTSENLADAGIKGHMSHPENRPRGAKHHLSKLTDAQWAEALALYDTGEWTQSNIAARYGITRPALTHRLKVHRKSLGLPTPSTRVKSRISSL